MIRNLVFSTIFLTLSQTAFAMTCEQVDKEMANTYKAMSQHSSYYGNYDDYEFEIAADNFYQAIGHYTVLENGLACPLEQAKNVGISVHTSKDGKFRTLSWDMLTGGTMHHFDSLIQYRGANNDHVLTKGTQSYVIDLNSMDVSLADGKSHTIYLVTQHFQGSISNRFQSLNLYQIDGDKLLYPNIIKTRTRKTDNLGFEYDLFSIPDNKYDNGILFEVDSHAKTISFPIVINNRKYSSGKVTNNLIKYQFDGSYFRKITP